MALFLIHLGCGADGAGMKFVAAGPLVTAASVPRATPARRPASRRAALPTRERCCSAGCIPAAAGRPVCCSASGPEAEPRTLTQHTREVAAHVEAPFSQQRQGRAEHDLGSWQAAPPAASLSRAFYSVQPARIARSAGSSGSRGGTGVPLPSPLLVVALTVGAAVTAALRSRLRTVRECGACRGYGLKRCKLCAGHGAIDWEGKMAHREPCPLCLGRRFTRCTCCGGGPFPARTLFTHRNSGREAGLVAQLASLTEAAQRGRRWPRGLGLGLGGRSMDDGDERMAKSDALAEQIMMD